MKALFKFKDYSESDWKFRWTFTWIVSGLVGLVSVMLAILCFKATKSNSQYLGLFNEYDGGSLLQSMACIGFSTAMVAMYGAVYSSQSIAIEKFKKIPGGGKPYLVWSFVLAVGYFLSILILFFCSKGLPATMKAGFADSMLKYHKFTMIKNSVDAMQKNLKCCGNLNYTDWFYLSWTASEGGEPAKSKEGVDKSSIKSSSTPNSCCSVSTSSCINRANGSSVKEMTVYKNGCAQIVRNLYAKEISSKIIFFAVIFLLELVIAVMVWFSLKGFRSVGKKTKKSKDSSKTNKSKTKSKKSTTKSKSAEKKNASTKSKTKSKPREPSTKLKSTKPKIKSKPAKEIEDDD